MAQLSSYSKFTVILFALLVVTPVFATPTALFWTNYTTEVLETGYANFDQDDYFSLFSRRGQGGYFSPDVGLELGVFTWHSLRAEAGIDYFGGSDDPLFFNAKIGIEEEVAFSHAPSTRDCALISLLG